MREFPKLPSPSEQPKQIAADEAPKQIAACAKPVVKKRSKKLKGDGDGTSEESDGDQQDVEP